MYTILITGGAGFIGSHIQDRFLELGHRVIVLDNLVTGSKENLHAESLFYEYDVMDLNQLEKIFSEHAIDVVCHHAGQINIRHSVEDPLFDAKSNIEGTLQLLTLAHQYSVKKFIFASTGGALYGDAGKVPTPEDAALNPCSPYGISKWSAERYIEYYGRQFDLSHTIFRYANVYGPRQNEKGEAGVVSIFVNQMLRDENPTIFGTGEQTRDYVYVDDVVRANEMAVKQLDVSGIFNVSTGVETSVNGIFDFVNDHFDKRFEKQYGDALSGEQMRSCLSFDGIRKHFAWESLYSLEEGIKKTYESFRLLSA